LCDSGNDVDAGVEVDRIILLMLRKAGGQCIVRCLYRLVAGLGKQFAE
jgi:hypothetical protein